MDSEGVRMRRARDGIYRGTPLAGEGGGGRATGEIKKEGLGGLTASER